jgi:hypothetical protein
MKKLFPVLLCAVLVIAGAGYGYSRENTVAVALPPDLIVQIHFVGGEQISADANSSAFTNLWCSPEAQALREQTLNKLSHAPHEWFKGILPGGAGDGSAQLRPLLDDLLQSEWLLEVRDATNGSPELALAIRLNPNRAQLWQTNLANVFESWTELSVKKNRDGWELKKHLPPNLIRFVRAGNWVVFGWGQDELPLNDALVRRVLAEKRPASATKNYWLSADVDWAQLARRFSLSVATNFPETRFEIVGRGGNLRVDGKLILSRPLTLSLEPWRMPTNTIHTPFVSFAAVRGFAPWLEKQGWAQPFEIQPLPNQAFIWALKQIPFQTFVAVPVENATNVIQQIGAKLAVGTHTNLQNPFLPSFTVTTNGKEIFWHGFPFIVPALQPVREPVGDFLLAGLFPNSPGPGSLPTELLAQLDRTNLIFYHWEITAERLPEVRSLSQLAFSIAGRPQLGAQSAASKWLDHVGPVLGNSVTEITQTAPDEWTFKRKAPGGLTALELVALANWLEATNFPCYGFRLSPSPKNPAGP